MGKSYFRFHFHTVYQKAFKFTSAVWEYLPGALTLSRCTISYLKYSSEVTPVKATFKQWEACQMQSLYSFQHQCSWKMMQFILNGSYVWYLEESWCNQKHLSLKIIGNLLQGVWTTKDFVYDHKTQWIPFYRTHMLLISLKRMYCCKHNNSVRTTSIPCILKTGNPCSWKVQSLCQSTRQAEKPCWLFLK